MNRDVVSSPPLRQVVNEASLTDGGFLPDDGSGVVVGLQDVAEVESACVAAAGGDVLLFNLSTCQVGSTSVCVLLEC